MLYLQFLLCHIFIFVRDFELKIFSIEIVKIYFDDE